MRTGGLFLYDGTQLTPFPTSVDGVLKDTQLYRGAILPDGTIALTTTSAGLFILDHKGQLVIQVNRANGLPSDVVYFVMPDREGALWLGLDAGIARVEVPSPVSFFDAADGLPGTPSDLVRYDGRLYMAGQTGLLYLAPPAHGSATGRFEKIATDGSQCWSFAAMPPVMTVACSEGLYEITGLKTRTILAPADGTFRASLVRRSTVDPTRLWVALFDGVTSFRYVDGRWIHEGRIPGITDEIRTLFENKDGSVWAGSTSNGALRISFPSRPAPGAPRPVATVERFGEASGLPPGGSYVADAAGTPLFQVGTEEAYVVRFDEAARRFVRDETYGPLTVDTLQVGFGMLTGPDGAVYIDVGRRPERRPEEARRQLVDGPQHLRPVPARELQLLPGGRWSDVARAHRGPHLPCGHRPRLGHAPRLLRAPRPARHGDSRSPDLRRRERVGRPPQARRRRQCPAHRVRGSRVRRRVDHGVPVAARRARAGLVGLDPRRPPRLHEPRLRRLPLPRPCARGVGSRSARRRVYAFAILPPWYRTWWAYLGLSRAVRPAVFVGSIACSAAAWSARERAARAVRRGAAARRGRRGARRRPKARARRTSSC